MTLISTVFQEIVDLSGVASVVILFVLAARLLLRKAPKIFSYALWGIVLVRLLIPFAIPSPVSVVPEIRISQDIRYEGVLPEIEFETSEDRQQNIQKLQNAVDQNITYVPHMTIIGPEHYLGVLWAVGVAAMTIYSILSYRRIRKRIAISLPLRDNIYLADDIQSPFVIGLFRPKIYLPCSLGGWEQEYIILHEQHHIRRLDHIVKALAFLALTIHWFNPLVWLAFVLSIRDMEMSCDEAVIRKAGEDIRGDYSASLLTLATGKRIIAGTPLAFGEGDTKGRIRNLANLRRPAFWVILLALILCILLAVCLLTNQAGNSKNYVGGTWYYGTVIDQAMGKVNEKDYTGRPYITIRCDDGEEQLFWLGKYSDDPGDILGQYVMIYSVIESGTDLQISRSIQTTTPLVRESLDEAVYYAIMTMHRGKYLGGECQTAYFKQLSYEESCITTESGERFVNEINLYGVALYQEFDLKDGILEDTSGSCCPAVLTFAVSEDGKLTLKEFWEPRDGEYYPRDIRIKFQGRPSPDTHLYYAEMHLNTYAQAVEYFNIGHDVVIHTILSDMAGRSRWHPYFGDLVEACRQQRTMLQAYGTDTLKFCFSKFREGGNDFLYGQLMSFVCSEIMESMGENPIGNWSFQQSGQDWFRALTARARKLIQTDGLTMEELKVQYPGTYLLLTMEEGILEEPDWGLTLTAEQVSPVGLTLVFHQSGGLLKGQLFTGQPFFLQQYDNGAWVSVRSIGSEAVFTMEAIGIRENGETRLGVNWAWIYGELAPGHYRIGKHVSETEALGKYTESILYAEFTIP